ncbi:MAG: IS5 family transposase [Smithellaceae bacterium]|nr:IS5 family transposase [Smithellaceae bacterium]
MAFKAYNQPPTFLDIELQHSFGHSRTQQFLQEVNETICWEPLEKLVTEHYPVGQSDYGHKAYPPLMLLKTLFIQKWFGITSDPELESQINDRLSFKSFIGLPFSATSPDHSIICRFRERIGKDILEQVHHELLCQLSVMGFSIESGMAVDARVVRSASRPVGDKKLKELREKRKIRAQMRKKTQRAMRFQRDLDSDWTVKNKQPLFGMKEHAAIDVESGLVLSTCVSKASEHDTRYFSYVVTKGIHGKNPPRKVYADKGYCGEPNRDFLNMNGMGDGIMRKHQINAALTDAEFQRNKDISTVRYKIEQYFGITQKYHRAGKARFTTIMKEHWDHLCGAMAFNIKRVVLTMRKREMMAAT